MKKGDLFETIGGLDEKIVQEAEQYEKKKNGSLMKFAIPALCMALAAAAVIVFPRLNQKNTEGPAAQNSANQPAAGGLLYTVNAVCPEAEGENMDKMEYLSSDEHWQWMQERRQYSEQSMLMQGDMEGYYREMMNLILADSEDNTVCSPLNIWFALAMLGEVTDGNTRQQILDVLNVKDTEQLQKAAEMLFMSSYADTPALTSRLADSFWLNQSVSYKEETLNTLAQKYFASSHVGTPGTPEMDEALQKWTDFNTGGELSEYAKNLKLDESTVLALVSAIYYKASWMDEFEQQNTTRNIFHGTKGDTETLMMNGMRSMGVLEKDSFRAVRFPLTDSGYMYFFLPSENNPDALVNDPEVYRTLREECTDAEWTYAMVDFKIPKFRVSADTDLLEVLQKAGITDALDPAKSDFTPLTDDSDEIYVSGGEHAAMVEIDEQGVTGAAFTMMANANGGIFNNQVIEFHVDRPFFFAVTSVDHSILFSGIIRNLP